MNQKHNLLPALTACICISATLAAFSARNPGKPATSEPVYTPAPHGSLTFATDIRPIVAAHCSGCHRPGEVAPFALLSAADVKKRARQIAEITTSRTMPPWKANSHGEFQDENRLTSIEIGKIKQWSDEGAAEGSASAPIVPESGTSEWRLGKPDAILAPAHTYTLAAEGHDEFHTFLLHNNFNEDVYLSAVEVKPGNRKIVHHTILYTDNDGRAKRIAADHGGEDYASTNGAGIPKGVVDIWTPGKLTRRLPDGIGMLVPKGTDLVLEVHYHRSGKPETDLTRAALYFTHGAVKQRLRVYGLAAPSLLIPAGEKDYVTEGNLQVPDNVTIYSIFPHMHLLGKQMTVDMTRQDGATSTMIEIPQWDFNWQNTYLYNTPVKLSPGVKLHMIAHYDNSTANPNNPNSPPKLVTWGEQTTDEMSLCFFGYTVDRENIPAGITVPEWKTHR